jgi:hypothetical protein
MVETVSIAIGTVLSRWVWPTAMPSRRRDSSTRSLDSG